MWYEPGYEPEQETARLPDLFYEVMEKKEIQVVLMECFHLADGAVFWLQIPEIRTEKNGAGLMPAGGFVYV